MATYYFTVTQEGKRRFRRAAKACGARFASRGARAVLTGDAECVWLRAGGTPTILHRDNASFETAKKDWL